MNELRPCPFCGGPAKIHKQFDGIHPGMIRGWFVNCNSKGCPIFATTRVRKMKADAIAEWNTRIDIKNPAPGDSIQREQEGLCSLKALFARLNPERNPGLSNTYPKKRLTKFQDTG